jgi:S-methylmethionine-dependent homocysteine/selenocysteine methylase
MAKRVTVLDGGMGRELLRIGAPFQQPEWSAIALWEGPDWVVQAHTNFIEAGAEVITTNSYAIVPFHIGEERFASEGRSLADLCGRLARQAADSASSSVRVAGSLPPLFGSYRPDLFDAADAARIIDPLISGLAPHVDVWLGETLSSIAEAVFVRGSLTRAGETDTPLWIAYSLAEGDVPTLRSGESVADAVLAARDLGATAVLFNCCQVETIGPAIEVARAALGDSTEVGAYANRFVTSHEAESANAYITGYRDDVSPEIYAEYIAAWMASGASILGGCCGMGPDHIAEITRLATA